MGSTLDCRPDCEIWVSLPRLSSFMLSTVPLLSPTAVRSVVVVAMPLRCASPPCSSIWLTDCLSWAAL